MLEKFVYIKKSNYYKLLALVLSILVPLLLLILLNSYYFITTHGLLMNMLIFLPLFIIIVIFIIVGAVSRNSYALLLGAGIPMSILSLVLMIGTLVKSDWSLKLRLPMSLLLLVTTVLSWIVTTIDIL